jgi:hypothetical protein
LSIKLDSLTLLLVRLLRKPHTSEKINPNVSSKTESPKTLEFLTESTLQLSINERLLLVEAITQSIRKETNLVAS